jgi:hypothetical protein
VEVSVFASYAHDDDHATYGRISKIVDDVGRTYQSLTGASVSVFKDTESISLGEVWRDKIRAGLASSSIMLAFISPAYLRSVSCRQELREFLASPGRRLIIPVIFADKARIKVAFGNDALWEEIERIQYLSVPQLRSAEPGSEVWLLQIERISVRIGDVLTAFQPADSSPLAGGANEPPATTREGGEPGVAMPDVDLSALRAEIESIRQVVVEVYTAIGEARPQLQRAGTFAIRLATARHLGTRLSAFSDRLVEAAGTAFTDISGVDPEVRGVLEKVRSGRIDATAPDISRFVEAVYVLASEGLAALSILEDVHGSIGAVLGVSSDLDRPLRLLQSAIVQIAEVRGLLAGWCDEIVVLRGTR